MGQGLVIMARRKRSRKRNGKSVSVITTVGMLNSAYFYGLGGSTGLNALKSGDFNEWSRSTRRTWQSPARTQFGVNAPLIAGIVGKMFLKRKNPGIKIGNTTIRLF